MVDLFNSVTSLDFLCPQLEVQVDCCTWLWGGEFVWSHFEAFCQWSFVKWSVPYAGKLATPFPRKQNGLQSFHISCMMIGTWHTGRVATPSNAIFKTLRCNATRSCVHTKLASWCNFRTLLTLSRSTKNWNISIRKKRTSSLRCNAPGASSPQGTMHTFTRRLALNIYM